MATRDPANPVDPAGAGGTRGGLGCFWWIVIAIVILLILLGISGWGWRGGGVGPGAQQNVPGEAQVPPAAQGPAGQPGAAP